MTNPNESNEDGGTMTTDLLPCPFCGADASKHENDDGGSYISCNHCNASSHLEYGRKENLIDVWNRRAAQASIATPQPQSVRDFEDKDAVLKLELNADSGYRAKAYYRISAEQWGDVLRVCEGKLSQASASTPQQTLSEFAEKAAELVQREHGRYTGSGLAQLIRALIEPLSAATCVCSEPQAANTVHRADGPCYQSAATGGQESEAQAIAIVDAIEVDPSKRTIKCLSYERLLGISAGTKLYTDPPSALAIDAAANRQAAEVLEGGAETAEAFGFDGDAKNYRDIKAEILATIPQDGITALEEFGMKVANAVCDAVNTQFDVPSHDERAVIVTSLIGEK